MNRKRTKKMIRRQLSYEYISKGNGIEIGPTFLPLPLKKNVKVNYLDIMSKDDLLKTYPELKNKREMVNINIIDNGEKLNKVHDSSLDFIIANHFIEHTIDPIKTLAVFLTKLRENGIIFMAVPDIRMTFDRDRSLTQINHIIDVYTKGYDPLLEDHYRECVKLIEKQPKENVENRIRYLKDIKYSIHFHTFTLESFGEIISYMQKKGFPIDLLHAEDIQEGTDEFILILKKNNPSTVRKLLFQLHRKKKRLLRR